MTMKKLILFLAFYFCFFIPTIRAGGFEINHGIGVIHIDFDSLHSIEFWSSTEDELPSHKLVFVREPFNPELVHFEFDKLKRDSVPPWFKTLFFLSDLERRIIDFNCMISVTNSLFQTNITDPEGHLLWIKKDTSIYLWTWSRFYQSMGSVEVADRSTGYSKFYSNPDANSNFVYVSNNANEDGPFLLRALEIKGHFMRVEIINPREDKNGIIIKTAWIQWRDEEKPLIKFNFMNC